MNKVVREHYPVANLPEDLRQEFEGTETVRVVVENARVASAPSDQDFWSLPLDEIKPLSPNQFRKSLQDVRNSGLPGMTPDEAVRYIRDLRDEWESE